jgi:hypothetical protein
MVISGRRRGLVKNFPSIYGQGIKIESGKKIVASLKAFNDAG